jgi:hypothetical protein
VGASGTNVSAAGSYDTTTSKPLNWEPAAVTSKNRSKSVPGVTICDAGVSPALTAARAIGAMAMNAATASASHPRRLVRPARPVVLMSDIVPPDLP